MIDDLDYGAALVTFFVVSVLVIGAVYTKALIIAEYDRSTGHVRAHLRGRGKPSLVLRVVVVTLLFVAIVWRAAL
jgi:hypothetical protein